MVLDLSCRQSESGVGYIEMDEFRVGKPFSFCDFFVAFINFAVTVFVFVKLEILRNDAV